MEIKFPLLSVLSMVVLLLYGLQGSVELYSVDVGFSVKQDQAEITIDPTFVVWESDEVMQSMRCWGYTWGNVSMISERWRGTMNGNYMLAYETTHVKQFYSLGNLIWPLSAFVPIEPDPSIPTLWNDPSQVNRIMWVPSEQSPHLWHFLTLRYVGI